MEEVLKKEFNEIFSNGNWEKRGYYVNREVLFFRKCIEHKLKEAKKDYKDLLANYDEGNSTRGTDPSFKGILNASESIHSQKNDDLIASKRRYIQALTNAFARTKQVGTFGKSFGTGKIIPPQRLFCVPHTTRNIDEKR